MIYSIFMSAVIIELKIMGSMLGNRKNCPCSNFLLMNNAA